MKPIPTLQMMAAPLASLFLVLSLFAMIWRTPVSAGVRIPMLRLNTSGSERCSDSNRVIVVRLLDTGELYINSEPIEWKQLKPMLGEILEHRFERLVYVVPESGVAYVRFADMMDKVASSASDLHIALISGDLKRKMRGRYLGSCELISPEGDTY